MDNNNNNNIGFKKGSINRPIITVANKNNQKLFFQELKNNMRNGWEGLNLGVELFIIYIMMKVVIMSHILERQKNN